jgi:hypothetical protein
MLKTRRKDTKLAKARRVFAKDRGGDLPPATDANDLLERKKHLRHVEPVSPRDVFGRKIGARRHRTRRLRR